MASNSVSTVANPAPLGLAAFGITTLVLSFYNAGISVGYGAKPNAIVGLALFYGGLSQFLAGMWEFKNVNTFGATALTSYGAFWMSYATLLIPAFGVSEAYLGTGNEEFKALGVFLMAWTIFTFMMFLCTFKQNVGLVVLFFFLTLTFMLLSIANFRPHQMENFTKAGGWFGIVTAFVALYVALAGLATPEHTFFKLPLGNLSTGKEIFD